MPGDGVFRKGPDEPPPSWYPDRRNPILTRLRAEGRIIARGISSELKVLKVLMERGKPKPSHSAPHNAEGIRHIYVMPGDFPAQLVLGTDYFLILTRHTPAAVSPNFNAIFLRLRETRAKPSTHRSSLHTPAWDSKLDGRRILPKDLLATPDVAPGSQPQRRCANLRAAGVAFGRGRVAMVGFIEQEMRDAKKAVRR